MTINNNTRFGGQVQVAYKKKVKNQETKKAHMMGRLPFDSLKEKKPWNFSPQADVGAQYTNLRVAHIVHSFHPWCYIASLQPGTPQ